MDRRQIIKNQILEYMMKECRGVKNAKPRKVICDDLVLEDRLLRDICVELKEEGHIATTASDGYFAIPLVQYGPLSDEDKEAIQHSISDKYSRATKLIAQARAMTARLENRATVQLELV